MADSSVRRAADQPQGAGETEFPDDAVEVGRITGAWGVRGAIRVAPHAAEPQALLAAQQWFLKPPEGPPLAVAAAAAQAAPKIPPLIDVVQARRHGEHVVATAPQLKDRNAAEALKGARVFVSRTSFPRTDDGEFYWIDLIGLDVVNREGLGLGRVADLLDTGPHSVLRVQAGEGDAAQERLIPFVAAYVDQVDLAARRITVDWSPDY